MKFSARVQNDPNDHQVTLKVGDRENPSLSRQDRLADPAFQAENYFSWHLLPVIATTFIVKPQSGI